MSRCRVEVAVLCKACALIAVVLVAQTAPPTEETPAGRAVAHLDRATSVIRSATHVENSGRIMLASLIDAMSDAVAPSSVVGVACGANMAVASWNLVHGAGLDQTVIPLIERCYRETHEGASFKLPEGVRTPEDAKAFMEKQLSLARKLIIQQEPDAVRPLIETIMFIVTPIGA